jgi:hypothetical protein
MEICRLKDFNGKLHHGQLVAIRTIRATNELVVFNIEVNNVTFFGSPNLPRIPPGEKEMKFEMCGQRIDAKADVCVMERSGAGAKYLLLVQEDKVRQLHLCVSKVYLRCNTF